MNIGTKIFKEILAKRIQQHVKRATRHGQVGFIPGARGWCNVFESTKFLHYTHRMKDENHRYFNRCRKST